ncbi:ABC transporter ATP-binding protein [Solibacillus sp. R5-41]|uniref:ABC transporter ATP-binding protein n=1 Tax=Solibacillus sp. R5-41 TaxID=2048654 RepID=UPI000C12530C|nr:ABC transporter ATP-binding protein [Solibacillus sp. R5-41]ATP38643.1 ABC transporter ATP-binding protein [Solibacillus sp. R5-41]
MITVKNLTHAFTIGKKDKEKKVYVLKGIEFSVEEGEIVSIVGKSGSGKSTLLQVLAGFLKPNSGSVLIRGTEMAQFSEKESAAFRLKHFGFIFQNFQLLPGQNVFENVELPLKLKGINPSIRKQKVQQLLERVGLSEVADHYPNELSGGQQQRVSIARAMVTDPPVILADEPTGSLDMQTEQEILSLIQQLNSENMITFIIITHDEEVASIANRTLRMSDGVLKEANANAI